MNVLTALSLWAALAQAKSEGDDRKYPPEGFVALFNGKDLSGWKVPARNNGAWKVVDGVIDCDGVCREEGEDRHVWTEKSYGDFVLLLDWRFKTDPNPGKIKVPVAGPGELFRGYGEGYHKYAEVEADDSGVLLRGSLNNQCNIWNWPVGSGELLYDLRRKEGIAREVIEAATPKKRADKPFGEWNRFEITLRGKQCWVKLNGEEVITNALLPAADARGPVGLQHHNWFDKDGKSHWTPTYIQFKNLYIKELP
jgi:hypothetical protein